MSVMLVYLQRLSNALMKSIIIAALKRRYFFSRQCHEGSRGQGRPRTWYQLL